VSRRIRAELLREAMALRGRMKLASYDRLSPSQDLLPSGGVGNLIAAPLFKPARDASRPSRRSSSCPASSAGQSQYADTPLSMVHAGKIVTAVARGTASTRWPDFADMYSLTRRHPVDGTELGTSIRRVAQHRSTRLGRLLVRWTG
jgi:TOTE conflict system, Archaeo-Eukaryotic Primase domain